MERTRVVIQFVVNQPAEVLEDLSPKQLLALAEDGGGQLFGVHMEPAGSASVTSAMTSFVLNNDLLLGLVATRTSDWVNERLRPHDGVGTFEWDSATNAVRAALPDELPAILEQAVSEFLDNTPGEGATADVNWPEVAAAVQPVLEEVFVLF